MTQVNEKLHSLEWSFVFALPIFPGSRPPSIVGADVLNFCVRDGNRWTHIAINTNSCGWLSPSFISKQPNCSNSKLNYSTNNSLCQEVFMLSVQCTFKTEHCFLSAIWVWSTLSLLRSSFRLISISQLNTLLHLHL